MQGGAGSAAAVGLTGCQQACEMAQPDCDAIAYNAKLQACFLKQDPSDDTCQVGASCYASTLGSFCFAASKTCKVPCDSSSVHDCDCLLCYRVCALIIVKGWLVLAAGLSGW